MLLNYLKVALRNFYRNKLYTFINILGLSLGVAVFITISYYVNYEMSIDSFHTNVDRIVRLTTEVRQQSGSTHYAVASKPTAPAFEQSFPEITSFVRTDAQNSRVTYKETSFTDELILYADSTFFDVFSFQLIEGNPQTVLETPNSIVITPEFAEKYFGTNWREGNSPINQVVEVNGPRGNYELKITGIVEAPAENATMRYDAVASFSTIQQNFGNHFGALAPFTSYLLLEEGISQADLQSKFAAFKEDNLPEGLGNVLFFHLQSLKDVYFSSQLNFDFAPKGNLNHIYALSILAIFVLVIACINYMNLATAKVSQRMKEIAMRKVLGSVRMQLIVQFYTEASVITSFAMLLGVCAANLLLPYFNEFTGKDLAIAFDQNQGLGLVVTGVGLLVILISGAYPAFYLSGKTPLKTLKFKDKVKGLGFRKVLVVLQFCLSIGFVAGALVIVNQLEYMQEKEKGYDTDNVLMLGLRGQYISENAEVLKEQIRSLAVVEDASLSLTGVFGLTSQLNCLTLDDTTAQSQLINVNNIDYQFVNTFGVQLIEGRNLTAENVTDATNAVLVNEAAVKQLGFDNISSAINQRLELRGSRNDSTVANIVGVFSDYHYASLHQQIEPLILRIRPRYNLLAIKMNAANTEKAIAQTKEIWESFNTGFEFDYTLLEQSLAEVYEAEEQLSTLFKYVTGILIFIACLGLFGLAAFTAEQRTKEIGIRKVLGASVQSVVFLLSKEFIILVSIALVLAVPATYYTMEIWLSDFAYRINIGAEIFILAGVLSITVALITVSYQSVNAAITNPVKTLRSE